MRILYPVLAACLVLCFVAVSVCSIGGERPRDRLIRSVPSPDGALELRVYRNNGGATVDWSVTVSVLDRANGRERNVYFHYHEYEPSAVYWLDNERVRIGDTVMNVRTDYYESFAYGSR